MASRFLFRLDPNVLAVEDAQSGKAVEFPHRVVVSRRRGLIVSLGEDEEAVRGRFAGRFEGSDLETLTLFGTDGQNLAYELRVLSHLRRIAVRESGRPTRVSLSPSPPGKGCDFALTIPGYELFPAARRRELEHAIQAHFRVRHLVINGQDCAIPASRRELEIKVRRLFVRALPGVAAVVGYLAAPASLRADRALFLAYLVLILVLVYYGGRVGWMLLARRIVPVDYCLYMLQNARGRASPIDAWLARALWGAGRPQQP